MQRCWGVIGQDLQSDVRLEMCFYQDNMKISNVVKVFKIDPDPEAVTTTVLITKMVENPDKYAFGMTVKYKEKSIMCCFDNKWVCYLMYSVNDEHYIEQSLSNG